MSNLQTKLSFLGHFFLFLFEFQVMKKMSKVLWFYGNGPNKWYMNKYFYQYMQFLRSLYFNKYMNYFLHHLRIGRRYALLISIFGMVAFSISTAFSPSYIVFVVLRFFTATFTISTFTTAYVLGKNQHPPSYSEERGKYSTLWKIRQQLKIMATFLNRTPLYRYYYVSF